jgi:hypothetical protein
MSINLSSTLGDGLMGWLLQAEEERDTKALQKQVSTICYRTYHQPDRAMVALLDLSETFKGAGFTDESEPLKLVAEYVSVLADATLSSSEDRSFREVVDLLNRRLERIQYNWADLKGRADKGESPELREAIKRSLKDAKESHLAMFLETNDVLHAVQQQGTSKREEAHPAPEAPAAAAEEKAPAKPSAERDAQRPVHMPATPAEEDPELRRAIELSQRRDAPAPEILNRPSEEQQRAADKPGVPPQEPEAPVAQEAPAEEEDTELRQAIALSQRKDAPAPEILNRPNEEQQRAADKPGVPPQEPEAPAEQEAPAEEARTEDKSSAEGGAPDEERAEPVVPDVHEDSQAPAEKEGPSDKPVDPPSAAKEPIASEEDGTVAPSTIPPAVRFIALGAAAAGAIALGVAALGRVLRGAADEPRPDQEPRSPAEEQPAQGQAPAEEHEEETPPQEQAPVEKPVEVAQPLAQDPVEELVEEMSAQEQAPAEEHEEEAPPQEQAPAKRPVEVALSPEQAPVEELVEEMPAQEQAPAEEREEETPAQEQAPAERPVEVELSPEQAPVEELAEEPAAQEQAPAEERAEEEPAQQRAPARAPAAQARRASNGRHDRHVKAPCSLPECKHAH